MARAKVRGSGFWILEDLPLELPLLFANGHIGGRQEKELESCLETKYSSVGHHHPKYQFNQ